MKTIIFRKHWNIWDKKVLGEVEKILEETDPNEIVEVSFSEIADFGPRNLAILLVMVCRIYDKTTRQLHFRGISQEVYDYLNKLRFFELNKIRTHNIGREKKGYPKELVEHPWIPSMWIQREKKLDNFIKELRNLFSNNEALAEVGWGVCTIITELLENCEEHSIEKTEELNAYAFCDNDKEMISIMITDFGIGFRKSLLRNSYNEGTIHSHKDAIKQVLEKHLTGRPNGIGGMGFQNIEMTLNKFGGRLLIASGNAVVIYQKSLISSIDLEKEIRGSTVYIELSKTR